MIMCPAHRAHAHPPPHGGPVATVHTVCQTQCQTMWALARSQLSTGADTTLTRHAWFVCVQEEKTVIFSRISIKHPITRQRPLTMQSSTRTPPWLVAIISSSLTAQNPRRPAGATPGRAPQQRLQQRRHGGSQGARAAWTPSTRLGLVHRLERGQVAPPPSSARDGEHLRLAAVAGGPSYEEV